MFNNLRTLRWSLLLAALVLMTVPRLQAQGGATGGIVGIVSDETGGVLPGVEVNITNTDTGGSRLVVTNDSGRYNAPNLPLGTYSVSAELTGFKTSTLAGLHLTVGATLTANLRLQVGEVSEQVTVVGGGEIVDTTSVTMQSLVDEVKIRELPLNGRDYMRLALLQPGTTQMRGQRQVRISPQTGTGLNMSISGGRPNSNTFRVDGIVANDAAGSSPGSISGENLGVDAIREFAVMSSTYGAEYGRGSGGVVNSAIRSGTNNWHGSLHYFHRNQVLDARNFFDGDEAPPFRRHQFGATAGGPLMQDRVFIFGAYEQLEQFRGETSNVDVPSPAAKTGHLVGPDGILNTADDIRLTLNPTIALFASRYPDPNGAITGDTGAFSLAPGFDVEAKFFTLRSDLAMNDANNVSLSYLVEDGDILQRDGLDRASLSSFSVRQLFAVNVTSVLSPSVINNVRIGYSRPYGATGALTSDFDDWNVPNPAFSFVPNRPPGILTITGVERFFTGFESEDTEGLLMQSTQVFEDVSWTRGDHDLKFGFNVEFDAPRVDAANRENGEYRYSDIAQFLQDQPRDFRAQFPGSDTRRFFRQNVWGGYIQDNIQMSDQLSLNFGLRFEFAEDVQEVDGQSVLVVFGNDYVTEGNPAIPRDFTLGQGFFGDMPRYEIGNFAPRFGFAYDVFGDGKTAIRGGFGVYGEMTLTPFLNLPGLRTPPFFSRGVSRAQDGCSGVPVVCGALGGTFPGGGFDIFAEAAADQDVPGVQAVDPIESDPPQPYRMQYNLNVQHQLAPNTVLSVGYVGALGRNFGHTLRDVNFAQDSERDGRIFFASGQTVRNTNWTRIGPRHFNSSNWYHGLQIGLNRRFTEGFRLQIAHTWAKTLDEGSTVFSQSQFDNGSGNPYFEFQSIMKGKADFNVDQQFVMNGTWDLPTPDNHSALLGGWQLGGVLSLITGIPNTPYNDDDRPASLAHDGGSSIGQHVDENGNGNDGGEEGSLNQRNRIFDPNLFAPTLIACSNGENTHGNCGDLGTGITQVGGFLGEVGRNTITGDGLVTVDLVLTKNTHVAEDVNLQFRWEIFNLLNNVNFDSPGADNTVAFAGNGGTSVNSSAGLARRTLTRSREMQLGLKLIF